MKTRGLPFCFIFSEKGFIMKTILAVISAVGILFGGGFVCGTIVVLVQYGKHPDMGHRHIHEMAEACGITDTWGDLNK